MGGDHEQAGEQKTGCQVSRAGDRDPGLLSRRTTVALAEDDLRGLGISAVQYHCSAQNPDIPRLPQLRPQAAGVFSNTESRGAWRMDSAGAVWPRRRARSDA